MAVESKPGDNATNGAQAGDAAAAALARRRRSSSLMQAASSLPTVEHSLEEFIAKANQTLVDVNTWTQAEVQAREEDARRKEQDAQRWKQAEVQMRESEAREQSLRRQLDGLQGKLAEAEARAAVAMSASASQSGGTASDGVVADLKTQIAAITERMESAEKQSERLSIDLTAAQTELRMSRSMPAVTVVGDEDAAERVRHAEAKAAKALAAARAAAAGLTVSSADLAAIESGLVVVEPPRKASSPVLPVTIAFIGGIAIMFGVWKLALNADDRVQPQQQAPAPQPQPAQVQPAPAPAPAPAPPPVAPTVTPIDNTAPAAAVQPPPPAPTPAPAPAAEPAKTGPTVTPIEEPAPGAATTTPPAAGDPKPAPVKKAPIRRPAKKAEPKDGKPPGGIVDPF